MSTLIASDPAMTPPRSRAVPGAWSRVWNIVRLHYTNRFNMVALPWLILLFVFVVNLVIWWSIFVSTHEPLDGTQWSGGTAYILIYISIASVQAMNLTFRFALGLGATRRDYFLGTAIAFLLLGAAFTVVFTLMSYVEQWTDGYGMNAHLFSSVYFGQGPLWQRLFSVFGACIFCFFCGALAGAVFVRWRANGLFAAGALLGALIAAFCVIATLTQSWSTIGEWLLQVKVVGVVAWLMIPSAAAAVAGYFILRKAPSRT
jgi:hypothetical protein